MNKILYKSHFELFKKLTPEQVYQLINKIGDNHYELTDPVCIGIWLYGMERDFKVQEENYNKVVENNRENGKKGGAPKGNKNAVKQPKTTETTQVVDKTTKNNPNNLKVESIEYKEESIMYKEDIDTLINSVMNSGEIFIQPDSEASIDEGINKFWEKRQNQG